MNPCCFAPLINLSAKKKKTDQMFPSLCVIQKDIKRNPSPLPTALSYINKRSFLSMSWYYQKAFSTGFTWSAAVQENAVTLRICMVSEWHRPCLNYAKMSNLRCLRQRERFLKKHGLISVHCPFLLVLLFERVISQRGLDGVLREHWRKINSTVRQCNFTKQ